MAERDTRKVSDLEMWELRAELRDVSRDHFMEAVHEYVGRLGEDLTGKNIHALEDRRCIRRTFENSQQCRLDSEDTRTVRRKAFQTEAVKLVIYAALTFSGFYAFLKA